MSGLAFFHPCNALEREIAVPDLAFDLRYLKYAMLAAEHGSFRRAAEALNLSQSTISRRIQLLERRKEFHFSSGRDPAHAQRRLASVSCVKRQLEPGSFARPSNRWRWLGAASAP